VNLNNKELKTRKIEFNRGMDTENVVHLHNEVLCSYYKQLIYEIHRQMDGSGDIILSEVTQSQKNTYDMHSLISGY
jgi:hypothetical protein